MEAMVKVDVGASEVVIVTVAVAAGFSITKKNVAVGNYDFRTSYFDLYCFGDHVAGP